MKTCESSTKPPLYFSRLFAVLGDHCLYLQKFEHHSLTYSLTAYERRAVMLMDHPYLNQTQKLNHFTKTFFSP